MTALGNVSVTSAAIIEGSLIIGLSDGSIINCGYVQGPQGLRGDPGPTGSTGEPGRDGNTIHTVAGTPRNDMGQDGDYAIDNINWRIYGPKSAGVWGNANDMLPSKDNLIVNGRGFEGGVGGSGDTGGGGGGTGGIKTITGGDGITATPQANPQIVEIDADIDASRGLAFLAAKLAINVGTGLEFDSVSGALKVENFTDLVTKEYVDDTVATATERLPYRIETDKVLREGKTDVRSGEAEVQLVDNEDNFTNVKFSGTNGIDVTSNASGIIFDGSKLAGDIAADLSNYATIAYSDSKDADLQNQIDDLSVSKGKVARYKVDNNNGTPVVRNGEFATNTSFYSNVNLMSFGVEDEDGALTKPMANGDIIETVNPSDGKVNRYKATDASGAPTVVQVQYISGDDSYVVGDEKQVYIYPQNEAGASKDYVDAQDALKLDLAGGTVTGSLVADGPVTINGDSEYTGGTGTENSLVNRKYVDDAVATGGEFLPITGGRMLGNLEFSANTGILAKGTSSLDNRASLLIAASGDKPIAISSGSSFAPALSIFGYDNAEPSNRKSVIDLKANGGIVATGSYVGQLIKSIRNTGYAFEAKPDDVETTALIRTNGSADFTNRLTLLKTDTTDHSGFTIKGTVADGSEGNLLQSYHNTGTNIDAVNYNGKTTEASNIVNKAYVDSVIGARPAQLMWRWEGDKGSTTTAPSAKRFLRSESSGTDYLRFSFETMNNVDLGDALFPDTNVSLGNGPIGCIWYQDAASGKWRLKMQFRVQSWRWNYNSGGGAHFEYGFSSRHGREWSNFTIGADYYVTVGGFF